MSSSWLIRTRQMSEAGKEILLAEALATHMRSPRDRKLVMGEFAEKHPIEDLISFFGAFYLYHYQGLRLLRIDAKEDLSIEEMEALTKKERELLEVEVRMMLGEKQREEIDVSRISSEFIVALCDLLSKAPSGDELQRINEIVSLLKEHVRMIPADYSLNSVVDFVNEITGWADEWRQELYAKASGLKESSLSLRDELLRPHYEEIVESTLLLKGMKAISGGMVLNSSRVLSDDAPPERWLRIAKEILNRFDTSDGLSSLKEAHRIRIATLDTLQQEIETPMTLEDYEELMGKTIVNEMGSLPEGIDVLEVLSFFVGLPKEDVRAALRSSGIMDTNTLLDDLKASLAAHDAEEASPDETAPSLSKEELEDITRNMRRLEKIEHTLEKPVKGMLKAKGLRASELDKISIEFLAKPRASLLGFEVTVLEELEKKIRVPPPEEISRLLQLRDEFKSGSLTGVVMSHSSDLGRKLATEKHMVTLRNDLVWFFTISILKNLSRVIESYIRSKHDIQRSKTLLKSIYEDSSEQLQFLREEILIDLLSLRLSEMKMIHPEMDATTIRTWYHARLKSTDLDTAKEDLQTSVSPVFAGIVDKPLDISQLSYDNYAIAFDLMQRFLEHQRSERDIRIEFVIKTKEIEKKKVEEKKAGLDVMNFIYTKANTVFRAIGRVGARGLEWNANDDAKCANLLAFFLNTNRGRKICQVCGEIAVDGKCSTHGKGQVNDANDIDNLSWFVMRAITDIKEGLIGQKADPLKWSEARQIVQRELSNLRRRGKITSKTNPKEMLPGEINYIVGPAIARVIGKYFNESLEYAARRAGIA